MSEKTALVLGSVSLDLDARESAAGSDVGCPGGVVHHAGRALARLGARTRVVTRAHARDERLLAPLREAGAEVAFVPCARTTCCANDYSGDVDRHELRETSEPIRAEHIPSAWRKADLVQLGPLHPEDLAAEAVFGLRGFRGLDIQGLVRSRRGSALVPSPELGHFLARADVVKASELELEAALAGRSLEAFVRAHAISELLITRGARGVTIVVGGDAKEVATARVSGGSTVGAGDVFLASFLWLRVQDRGPIEAARGAAALAAARIRLGEVPRGGDLERLA